MKSFSYSKYIFKNSVKIVKNSVLSGILYKIFYIPIVAVFVLNFNMFGVGAAFISLIMSTAISGMLSCLFSLYCIRVSEDKIVSFIVKNTESFNSYPLDELNTLYEYDDLKIIIFHNDNYFSVWCYIGDKDYHTENVYEIGTPFFSEDNINRIKEVFG